MKKFTFALVGIIGLMQFGNAQNNVFPSSGNVGIGTVKPAATLHVISNGVLFSPKETSQPINSEAGGIYFNVNDGGLELASANDNISYIDFKGKNYLNHDFKGRIVYDDGIGFTFIQTPLTGTASYNMRFTNNKLGIGTLNPDEMLTVKGKIHAEEVKVDLQVPADYVFQKYYTGTSSLKSDYQLPTLQEIEQFTKENHHLPDVPSAKEIQENGLQVGEMANLLLQKIEELTLYTIEQEKRIQLLEAKLADKN